MSHRGSSTCPLDACAELSAGDRSRRNRRRRCTSAPTPRSAAGAGPPTGARPTHRSDHAGSSARKHSKYSPWSAVWVFGVRTAWQSSHRRHMPLVRLRIHPVGSMFSWVDRSRAEYRLALRGNRRRANGPRPNISGVFTPPRRTHRPYLTNTVSLRFTRRMCDVLETPAARASCADRRENTGRNHCPTGVIR